MLSLNHNAKIRNRWGVNSQLLILAHSLSYFFIDSFFSRVYKLTELSQVSSTRSNSAEGAVSRRRRKTVLVPQTNFLRLWHGKKNPWRYALKCFKTILPRTFLCLPCWQRLTFIATTRSSIFYRTIQTTWNSGTPPFHVSVVRHEEKCFFLSVAG